MTKNAKRVRLTDDAIDDLRRLHRKDPRIVRDVFAKMLLLERASDAGEPLVGALVGFRKLVVGDRSWRIVWRETTDVRNNPVLDISEIWAAGAREDGEIYSEMKRRVEKARKAGHPQAKPLAEVLEHMGRLYSDIPATPEPTQPVGLPDWLVRGLREELHLPMEEIANLSEPDAQRLMVEHWSRKPE